MLFAGNCLGTAGAPPPLRENNDNGLNAKKEYHLELCHGVASLASLIRSIVIDSSPKHQLLDGSVAAARP